MKNLCALFRNSLKFCRHLNRNCSINALFFNQYRGFFQSTIHRSFYERDRRDSDIYTFPGDKPFLWHMKEGRKICSEHTKLLIEEIKEKFRQDNKFYNDGDTDVFFRFDSQDCLKNWRIGSDKMNKEGFSECNFIINDKNKAVFYGNIDTTPPKDGKKRFSGYCGIKSLRKTKAFFREDWYDWTSFTHLELRVKGDGRNYMVNLGLGMYFDVTWFNTFTYTMHTRGGPYWEVIRIPFSKFFLTAKGRIQDKQDAIPLNRVNSVGITSGVVSGPFHLEIDYIGCHKDESHSENSAYEMYILSKEFVS